MNTKKVVAGAGGLAVLMGAITAYYALPDNLRVAVVSEVRAGDAATQQRIDSLEEVETEDRLERLYYRQSDATHRSTAAPDDEVLRRAKISLERQIRKAEERLGQIRSR